MSRLMGHKLDMQETQLAIIWDMSRHLQLSDPHLGGSYLPPKKSRGHFHQNV